jgi:hypothetical protein
MTTVIQTIESAYFHWGNGGLGLKVQQADQESEQTPDTIWTTYQLKVEARHHGACFDFSFPLGSSEIVGWLHEVTGRLLKRMQTKRDKARNTAFIGGWCRLDIEDGKPADVHFEWKDGTLVRFKPVPQEQAGQQRTLA